MKQFMTKYFILLQLQHFSIHFYFLSFSLIEEGSSLKNRKPLKYTRTPIIKGIPNFQNILCIIAAALLEWQQF